MPSFRVLLITAFAMGLVDVATAQQRLLNTTVQDWLGTTLPPVRPLPPEQTTRLPTELGTEVRPFTFRAWNVDCLHQYVSPRGGGVWAEAVSTITIDPPQGTIFIHDLDRFLAYVKGGAGQFCEGKPAQAGQDIFRLPAAFHVSVSECDGCRTRFQATFDPVGGVWDIYDNQYISQAQ